MIPLSDIDRKPSRFPVITALIIGANILIFLLELLKGEVFIMRWSFIPSEIASGRNLITMLTAMFMHGGVLHIVGNMIYLWAFGPEIEDAMGKNTLSPVLFLGGLVPLLHR